MDLSSNYFIFQTAWPGLDKKYVVAHVDEKFNSDRSELVDAEINDKWAEKQANNKRLYAQTKFRLGALFDDTGELDVYSEQDVSIPKQLTLGVGLTDYKQFVGSNLNDKVNAIVNQNQNRKLLSDPIGVNGILLTADGFIIIVRRASWVGEHPNMLDTPGGHPEPSNLDPRFNMKHHSSMPDISILQNADVVGEIFISQQEELSVELNIPMDKLTYPKLLSIGRVSSGYGRPVMYFQLSTELNKSEIEESWRKGGQETDEATELIFIHQSKLDTIEQSEIWPQLSPNGHLSLRSLITAKQSAKSL